MDSLAPPKLPHQETPGSPSFPITVETPSPYEYLVDLSATSTPPRPLELMDAFELFWLSENIDDISKIVELLEPNPLMLRTWSYFGHCQQTARELEKEVWYQKDSAKSLLEELQRLGIDEVLCPLDLTTNYSMEADTRGPLWPIVIIDDDTTTPPTTLTSSSGPPFKKR